MKDDEALMWLFLVLVAAALFIFGYILWALVWFIVSAIIGYIAYRKHLKDGEQEFDEVARDLGVDLPPLRGANQGCLLQPRA